MFAKKNVVTLFVVLIGCAVIFWITGAFTLGFGWCFGLSGKVMAGLVVVYAVVSFATTMGAIGLMEADNENNSTAQFHFVKLAGSLLLLVGAFGLFFATMVPLGFHATMQGIIPLYAENPHATPLIKVKDTVQVPNPDYDDTKPIDPDTNPEFLDYEFDASAFEFLVVEETTLPLDEDDEPVDGTVRYTIVLDRADATGPILIPRSRVAGKGEVWFQEKNPDKNAKGRQSWVAPF